MYEEKVLPNGQKSLLIWDALKSQSTANASNVLSKHEKKNHEKNMTHLFQPLDLTTNSSLKKIEKRAFSKYLSSSIYGSTETGSDSRCHSNTNRLQLSVLKPLYANALKEAYQFFELLKGKEVILSRWRAAV